MTPGSAAAIEKGCTCPVLDNGHGKGSGYVDKDGHPVFWYDFGCPVHGKADLPEMTVLEGGDMVYPTFDEGGGR